MRRWCNLLICVLALACMAIPSSASAYVFWNSNGGSIGRADNDGGNVNQSFILGAEGAEPLAVDSTHLYYTTDEESQMGGILEVVRTNLDGGEATPLPEGFQGQNGEGPGALDAGHLYFVDSTGIGRAGLDGGDPEPEFIDLGSGAEIGGIAVYAGFVYWTNYDGGFGHEIGRANLGTRVAEEQYIDFEETAEAAGPRAIAVDAAGIFWTLEPAFDGPYQGNIAHAGFGGAPDLDQIAGANAEPASGLAIDGSDLYWFDYEEGFGTSLALAVVGGSDSVLNRHLVDHVGNGWLAANSAGPPPTPPPPPPSATPGPVPGPAPSPSPAAPVLTLPVPKVKLDTKAGAATLTLVVPGPGEVVLSGSGIKRFRKAAKTAGPVALSVRPSKATATKLKKAGSAKVTADITFTPTVGVPQSESRTLTLKRTG